MFPACAVILTRWTALVQPDTNLRILSPCAKLPSFVQVLIRTLLDTVGAASAPIDSPALLNGLVDVQSATQLMLLQKIPFHVPTYKVTVSLCAACKASFMQWILCHAAQTKTTWLPEVGQASQTAAWLIITCSKLYRMTGPAVSAVSGFMHPRQSLPWMMHHAACLSQQAKKFINLISTNLSP